MKRILSLSLALGLVASCSTLKPKPKVSEHANEVPAWAYAPAEGCSESAEMCASGEGPTSGVADANAMKSLASIFEVRVEASTSSLMTMSNNSALRQSQETAAVAVKDEVAQTLKAASIKSRHRFKGLSYSLASLDKHKASDNIRSAMDTAQAELDGLWQRKDRAGWARMWELLITRDSLNDRYALIMGNRVLYSPNAEQLQKWYQARKLVRTLGWQVVELPEIYAGALKSRLSEAGIVLQTAKSGERIRANLDSKQGHIKVDGFEKWEFVLTVEHLGGDDKKKGTLSVKTTSTGRSKADCEAKAHLTLMKGVESALGQLNLNE